MTEPAQLEEAFNDFVQNFAKHVPDGIIDVDLKLLQELDLLNDDEFKETGVEDLTDQFHVLETNDKVTLFNEQFAVWIVPKMVDNQPSTLIFISLLPHKGKPQLELVFSTKGVYNSPKFIIKVLRHFLTEVIDNEAIISSIGKKK